MAQKFITKINKATEQREKAEADLASVTAELQQEKKKVIYSLTW